MRRAVSVRIAACALAALGAGGCGGRDEVPDEPVSAVEEVALLDSALASRLPEGATLEMAEEGRRHFPVCAVCHGLEAEGTALGSPLADGEWNHISGRLEEIEEVIRAGVAEPDDYPIPMPVLGGGDFTDEQIRALATYVYVLNPPAP